MISHIVLTADIPGSSAVKNLLPVQNTQDIWVQSLGWEDLLGKGMSTHSSTFVWIIQWTEDPGGLQSMGSQRVRNN